MQTYLVQSPEIYEYRDAESETYTQCHCVHYIITYANIFGSISRNIWI